MNPLGALGGAASSASTTGPATPGSAAADPAAPGFAGLFALLGGFGQPPTHTHSEPTALPLQALGAPESEPPTPALGEDLIDAAQPDPALLAALGLPPLPMEPAPAQPDIENDALGLQAGARGLPGPTLPAPTASALPTSAQDVATNLGPIAEGEDGSTTASGRAATPAYPVPVAAPPLPGAPQAGALPSAAAQAPNDQPASAPGAAPQPPRAGADFSGAELTPPPRLSTGAAIEAPPAAVAASMLPSGNRGALGERSPARVETMAPVGFERPEGLFREANAQHTVQAVQAALQPRMEPGSGQFGAQLGQQLLWMGQQKIGRAEIRLDPAELGPLTIELEMDGDEIRAEFSSRSAEVRALIDSQVPRLRELLAEQGFSLADAQVGQGRADERSGQSTARSGTGPAGEAGSEQDPSTLAAAPVRVRQGLVDDYA